MLEIVPSVASADPLRLEACIRALGEGCPLHLDVEDGNFIPNITFGIKTIQAVSSMATGELDAHLMTTRPEDLLEPLYSCGIGRVCAHIETLPYPKQFLRHAQALGMQAGLALNIKTPLIELQPFAESLDYVLLMTSEADYGEQTFFAHSYARIATARGLLGKHVPIWVDGGIGPERLKDLAAAGADTAIMGRAIFAQGDPMAARKRLLKITE